MAKENLNVNHVSTNTTCYKTLPSVAAGPYALDSSWFTCFYYITGILQMSPRVMMMGRCTKLETSGRRNIWVLFVRVPATEGSRYCRQHVCFCVRPEPVLPDENLEITMSWCHCQGWRCENCRRPAGPSDVEADLLQPVSSDVFDRYRENALRKLVGVSL